MAHLEEMLLQGIRSYPSDKQTVMKFVHPITIIQGPNGSGKTSLIEALNFLCTGALPPGGRKALLTSLDNVKGNRVDAIVKLRFRSKDDREVIVASRITNSFNKEGKATTKADEQTIKIITDKQGKGIALSGKTIDFQREVLNHLGIPKAILENVIFCHQENSTWPLSEPKILKGKFDDIFQLTNFVKFCDRLKKKIGDWSHRGDVAIEACKGAEALHKEKMVNLRRKEDLQHRMLEAKGKKDDLIKERDKASAAQQEAAQQLNRLHEVENSRGKSETRRQGIVAARSRIQAPEWSGTEDQLRREIDQMGRSDEFRSAEEQKRRCEQRLVEIDREIAAAQAEKQRAERELVDLLSDAKHLAGLEAELSSVVDSAAAQWGLRADVDMEKQLAMMRDEVVREGEERVAYLRREEESVRAAATAAHQSLVTTEFERKQLLEQRSRITSEVDKLAERLTRIGNNESEMPILRNKVSALEAKLDEARNKSEQPQAVSEMEQQKRLVMSAVSRLKDDVESARKWEEVGRDRERWDTEKKDAEKARRKIFAKLEDDIGVVYGRPMEGAIGCEVWEEGDQAKKIDAMLETARPQVTAHADSASKAELAAHGAQTTMMAKKKERAELKAEMQELREKISNCTSDEMDPGDIEYRLNQTMTSVVSFREELGSLKASAALYAKWSTETQQHKHCPMCERGFSDRGGVDRLAHKLSDMSFRIPEESTELEEKLRAEETEEANLRKATGYVESLNSLEAKERTLLVEITAAKEEAEAKTAEAEGMRGQLTKMQGLIDSATRIRAEASLLDAHLATIARLSSQLEAGESEWEKEGRAAVDGADRTKSKLEAKEAELESILGRLDAVQKATTEVNRITMEINALRDRMLSMNEDVVQQSTLQEALDAKKREQREIVERQADASRRLPSVKKEADDAQSLLARREAETRRGGEEAEAAVRKLDDHRARIAQKREQIAALQAKATSSTAESRLHAMEKAAEQLRQRKAEALHDIGRVGETQSKMRTLMDQLTLLETATQLAAIEEEMKGYGNIEQSMAEWQRKQAVANEKRTDAERAIGAEQGKEEEYQRGIKEVNANMLRPEMRNAEKSYVKALATKLVYVKGTADLQDYLDSVEKSMLDYHKIKMTKVNHIVDDLWRKIYDGGDIETIRIQSEQTGESEVGNKKQYNYKVMMKPSGAPEVDMRDRCSAGQKMLACLLIRMGLAEVFGNKCAIITLDEPTTNLDSDKIDNMADLITNLINTRANARGKDGGPKGLQLILITHDVRFVERIRRVARPEYIYVVKKNTGCSSLIREYNDGHLTQSSATAVLAADQAVDNARHEKNQEKATKRAKTMSTKGGGGTQKGKKKKKEEEEEEDVDFDDDDY